MPLIATRGAASAQGFGEFAQAAAPVYIEDVFSTYLYTGNGSTQTITNNIDLSTKGGLVWTKRRDIAINHALVDTARGVSDFLSSNLTNGNQNCTGDFTSFNTSGYTLGTPTSTNGFNQNSGLYASWTFREQPKFFDVVTYTGDNTSSKAISHNLGSVPGCVIVKRTDSTSHWFVWHRSTSGTPNNNYTLLNQTAATAVATDAWSSNAFTSTQFYVSNNLSTNVSGATYVAYVFAHNAGGFGLTGSDNVISCGSFTTDAGGSATVNLGYEPQWLLMRSSSTVDNWYIFDVMRGFSQTSAIALFPNGSSGDYTFTSGTTYPFTPTATGFYTNQTLNGSQNYIYIAIRRGPMKTPTSGTSVFAPYVTNTVAASSSGSTSGSALYRSDFVTDFVIQTRKAFADSRYAVSRLTGNQYLLTNSSAAEATSTVPWDSNIAALNFATDYGQWMFRRAPGFFDVVCWTTTQSSGGTTNISHNLGVVPEMYIVKCRSGNGTSWFTYTTTGGRSQYLALNSTSAFSSFGNLFGSSGPTSTTFGIDEYNAFGIAGSTAVAYLFASVSGVSKVGSYTGTGALQTVNCGFTTGARFVLIKRTDSTGDWWVYDSARGISSGNDPYLFINSNAAEVTGTNYVDTTSVGFQVTAAAPAGLNANGGTYIFLAIA